jgi:hypothetical protein
MEITDYLEAWLCAREDHRVAIPSQRVRTQIALDKAAERMNKAFDDRASSVAMEAVTEQ